MRVQAIVKPGQGNYIKKRANLIDGDDILSSPAKSTCFAFARWHDLEALVKTIRPNLNAYYDNVRWLLLRTDLGFAMFPGVAPDLRARLAQ